MAGERRATSDDPGRPLDVVVLCGGLGTRLRSVVSDLPKSLAQVGDRPFLDLLLEYFGGFGFKRFILCTGHRAEAIAARYAGPSGDIEIVLSREQCPLGTAGAVKHAAPHIQTDPFLVTNGDSLCPANLSGFVQSHRDRSAALSMVVAQCPDSRDYGTVEVCPSGQVTGFREKDPTRTHGLINAGIYCLGKEVLAAIPPNVKCSLEYDVFPQWTGRGFHAFQVQGPVMDIGTPDRLRLAQPITTHSLSKTTQSLSRP